MPSYTGELDNYMTSGHTINTVLYAKPDENGQPNREDQAYANFQYVSEHVPITLDIQDLNVFWDSGQCVVQNLAHKTLRVSFRGQFDLHAALHDEVGLDGRNNKPYWTGEVAAAMGTVTPETQHVVGSDLIPDYLLNENWVILMPIMECESHLNSSRPFNPYVIGDRLRRYDMSGKRIFMFTQDWTETRLFAYQFAEYQRGAIALLLEQHLHHGLLDHFQTNSLETVSYQYVKGPVNAFSPHLSNNYLHRLETLGDSFYVISIYIYILSYLYFSNDSSTLNANSGHF